MAGDDDVKDRDVLFHEKWLGLAQPIEGLVFSVPVLADAQIAPELRTELSTAFTSFVDPAPTPRIRSLERFFREFLGYDQPGMLVPRAELPPELSFYAPEGGQELRPSYALGRGPFVSDDPFVAFESAPPAAAPDAPSASPADRYFALLWDLTESGADLDLDAPEAVTGLWRYPPTAKFERLLRHVGIAVGFIFNGRELRLVYAPAQETTAHLTFRVEHVLRTEGRPLLAALDLLLHARRAYSAAREHTLEGLLAESRRRQADVTEKLAKQVFEAVEILVAGFEAAAARDISGDRHDWLRAALEEPDDHFYQGVLSVVLRLVFLLYAEDQSLLPVEHPTYSQHLSLFGLYARLSQDAGAHPESMHHRFGAYGQLLALFRAVFFGVKHGSDAAEKPKLDLPPRRGRLFDPNAYPFLEGGLPGWTAAVADPEARAAAEPPSVDDGTIYRVLHRLIVFEGQRLSYRTLDVEQIGSVYESLMGYHVVRLTGTAVRIGKYGVWVEASALRHMPATERTRFLKETCGLNAGPIQTLEKSLKDASDEDATLEALSAQAVGRKADILRHRATAGRLVLQPGEERRRTASHYTPRSLAEKVVRRTLEPLLACLGPERSPEQILQLKICDPAMGSGAFLVATCRELANEIVAAWTRAGALAHIIEEHGNAHLHARRLVAQKCLYGVDKNAAAVELAKLSLWLVTLSKSLPFTFVDHALRHGDSLVGLDFKQIEAFHWAPTKQTETCRVLLRETLDEAVSLRQQILELADKEDPASQAEKRRLLDFAQQAIDRVRIVADVCVGAFFAEAKDAPREKERKRRLELVERWLTGDAAAGQEVQELAADARRKLVPFHWWIEFPEVFFEERPDPLDGGAMNHAASMEGVVGNPPFMGGRDVSERLGETYNNFLRAQHHCSKNSDLAAHFFRRGAALIGPHGTLGLIATKTISEGDTRAAGLQHLTRHGSVYDAASSIVWPGDAAVVVSIVHLAFGAAQGKTDAILDGRRVCAIDSRLEPSTGRGDPTRLSRNSGVTFLGLKPWGTGFILVADERQRLLEKDPRNSQRTFPYVVGDDINNSPTHSSDRYAIHFGAMSEEEAGRWPDLLEIVRERVKPERDRLGDSTDSRRMKKYWWQYYGRDRPEMQAALKPLPRYLVMSRHTKHLGVTFQTLGSVYSEAVYVFALSCASAFSVLQSRVHEAWARPISSSLGDTLRYSALTCFETFPFPHPDPRTVIPSLEAAGQALYDARAAYMVDIQQGLTKTYNALKDPACTEPRILELRRLHEAMDRAVLDAYGWTDIAVPPFCPLSDADKGALRAFEDEVIDRLYVLNAQRAAEEERLGLTGKKGKRAGKKNGADEATESGTEPAAPKKARRSKKSSGAGDPEPQGELF